MPTQPLKNTSARGTRHSPTAPSSAASRLTQL